MMMWGALYTVTSQCRFLSPSGPPTANAFLVNGGDVEEGRNNGASIIPTLDSIQGFRLITNSFDAEYGRFSGAIVNVITKGGSNDFHGTGYEFLRNEKLDSRNFFDLNQSDPVTGQELPGTARGVLKRNQFGGAGGGPILKNRLFFFTDYEGTRQVRGISNLVFVPSLANRTGDFTDVDTTGYSGLSGNVRGDDIPGSHSMDEVLSQRLGYPVTSGEPYWVDGCNALADAQAGMCVFPGQVIPQAAWSPVAVKTLKFIPTPTAALGRGPPQLYWRTYPVLRPAGFRRPSVLLHESFFPARAGCGRQLQPALLPRSRSEQLGFLAPQDHADHGENVGRVPGGVLQRLQPRAVRQPVGQLGLG